MSSVTAPSTTLKPSIRRDVPAVEVSNLTKEFRRRDRRAGRFARRRMPALKGVTFTIERGECVAILGQNGSGKSTLVRLLSTLLLHDGGEARVFGHDGFKEQRQGQPPPHPAAGGGSLFQKMVSAPKLPPTPPPPM